MKQTRRGFFALIAGLFAGSKLPTFAAAKKKVLQDIDYDVIIETGPSYEMSGARLSRKFFDFSDPSVWPQGKKIGDTMTVRRPARLRFHDDAFTFPPHPCLPHRPAYFDNRRDVTVVDPNGDRRTVTINA